jgi:purine nucleosidase
MPEIITIDTDPGIDDALALLYSFCSKLPIQAITTVYGNSTVDNVTKNAGYIAKSIGAEWNIYKGADKPTLGVGRFAESHGQTGLGNAEPTDAEIKLPSKKTAQEYLTRLDTKDHNILFCIGPLTNLALAIRGKPGFLQGIHKLVIMGGAFVAKGNVTEFAEFNVYNDPEAAALVIDTAYKQRVDTTIIPVEVCRKVLLTKDDMQILQTANLLPDLQSIVEPFIDYYMNDSIHGGYEGAVLYDVLVPLYYLYPHLFITTPSTISVELGVAQRGRTTAVVNNKSSVLICTDVDANNAKELVMSALVGSSVAR